MTFLTAHKYLGLTREVIRTEKAINELACYPLPEAFFLSGGIHRLRQRFGPVTKVAGEVGAALDIDYFALDPPTPYSGPAMGQRRTPQEEDPFSEAVRLKFRPTASRDPSTRVAGDLHTATGAAHTPAIPAVNFDFASPQRKGRPGRRGSSGAIDQDFDLREAVMQSISKAIGAWSARERDGYFLAHPNFSP